MEVDELETAKTNLIRMVQKSNFSSELYALSRKEKVSRSSPLFKLHAFLDGDGLIRVGGRIHQSTLSDDVKHPLFLPSDHELSMSIVMHFHQKTHHQGRGITCSEVRSHGFWILSLQRLVKKIDSHLCYLFPLAR